jgi:VWFA-related protein
LPRTPGFIAFACFLLSAGAPADARYFRARNGSQAGQQTNRLPLQAQKGAYKVRVDVDSVFVNVSVRDRAGFRGIPGLGKDDFLVYEDGILQHVEQVAGGDAPINVLLLLDISGSTADFLPLVKESAIGFTRRIKANDRVAVATFNSFSTLLQDFTGDRGLAARAIGRIASSGGTALYDALVTCLDVFMRGVEQRSAIVAFSDGVDNQLQGPSSEGSRTPFETAYRKIQEADPAVYTIFLDAGQPSRTQDASRPVSIPRGIDWPGGRPPAKPLPSKREVYEKAREQLRMIADQTGGRMYVPRRPEDLSGVYGEIAADLSTQYYVGYNPTNNAHDGKWRSLRIEIRGRPDAVVRARKGYYARSGSPD